MSFPITPATIPPPAGIQPIEMPTGVQGPGAGIGPNSFQAVFSDALGQVQQLGKAADTSVDRFLSGENEEIHHVAMITQQSELAFELFTQVRNKVVQAYQEVMRMQM